MDFLNQFKHGTLTDHTKSGGMTYKEGEYSRGRKSGNDLIKWKEATGDADGRRRVGEGTQTNEKPLFVSVLALGRLLIPSLYLSMPLLYIYIYIPPFQTLWLVGG